MYSLVNFDECLHQCNNDQNQNKDVSITQESFLVRISNQLLSQS